MEMGVDPVAELAPSPPVSSAGENDEKASGVPVGISIIVPCWRDDAISEDVAARWRRNEAVREILVAAACAAPAGVDPTAGVRLVPCIRPGRGIQMNAAARVSTGELLLFQHADTELTDEHLSTLALAMRDPALAGGAFRRRFDERHPHLRCLEGFEAWRCRSFGPLFGDQSIFVRRSVFEALGGFAEVPLMEDVEFSCRLRRHGRLAILTPAIGSSARKHLAQGRWRSTLTNAFLLALYVFGVSPERLHRWYYRHR